MNWLLAEDAVRALQRAEHVGLQPTEQQRQAFMASMSHAAGGPRNLRVAGDVAEIDVFGVLTPTPDIMSMFFGGGNTTYADIQSALAIAQSDPAIKSAVLSIDSPGGTVQGLFETLAAIEAFTKPLRAVATYAASAAYAIASAARTIEATNPAATFGSVGVAVDVPYFKDVEVISLTSTEAPDKRPDLHTAEGRKVVVKHLDALHELFVDAIARGRRTSVAKVNERFGRGATLLAGEAKSRGMIDSIAGAPGLRSVSGGKTTSSALSAQEKKRMTLAELKAEHPELCDQLVAQGVAQERDRVMAHVTAGKQVGDLGIAIKAIEDGAPMTQQLMTSYMMVGLNRRDRRTRQQESDQAGAVLDGVVANEDGGEDIGERTARALLAGHGLTPEMADARRAARHARGGV